MTEEQERAAFEAWFQYDFMDDMDVPGEWDAERNCYVSFQTHMAWKGWQARAARASILTPDPLPSDLDEAIRLSEKEMR